MNYSDRLALIREYKGQGGKGSYLSLLSEANARAKGGEISQYPEGGTLPMGPLQNVPIDPMLKMSQDIFNTSGLSAAPTNKYIVKQGDTLSKIAALNKIPIDRIVRENSISNPNQISIGQEINLPLEGYNSKSISIDGIKHTINSGETISKISQQYGTDTSTIKRLNPEIKDLNKIYPGQQIKVKDILPPVENPTVNFKKLSPFELDEINATLPDVEKIKLNEQLQPSSRYYVIEDKKNHQVDVMDYAGNVIKSYNSVTGQNPGDALTVTYTGGGKNIISGKGNMSTPAGMFRITGSGEYHGSPSFTRGKIDDDYDIPSSVHKRFIPKDKSKCNVSNGCTGLDDASLKDIQNYIGKDSKWYILPENQDSGNFKLTGAGVSFISNDNKKLFSTHSKGSRDIDIIPPEHLVDNSSVNTAINVIKQKKPVFLDKLNMSSDTYDRLSLMALGIMGRESTYGDPGLRGTWGLIRDELGAAAGKNVSAGIYQLRKTAIPKEDFKKVTGISSIEHSMLTNDALATEAVLTTLYDIYKNIAPSYRKKYPSMSLDEITLAFYTNPQGVINPEKSELRLPYAKTVLENSKGFKINYLDD